MKLYCENNQFTLYNGSMLDMLEAIEPNSIDSIVTDPPYELNFMNKGWDNSGIAFQRETWEKCFTVLKSGGYLLAFGGSRTFHRIACAIEDAGFEIRDTIMWLYGSGFPKSMNIGLAIDKKNGVESPVIGQNQDILKKQAKDLREGHRKIVDSYNSGACERNNGFKNVSADIKEAQNEWGGWGTALKPAYEPIIVARKPCEGSCVDNVLKYGVGGINIEECRIGTEERTYGGMSKKVPDGAGTFRDDNWVPKDIEVTVNGRFPANVILTYDETDEQEVCGGFPYTKSTGGSGESSMKSTLGMFEGGWNSNKVCSNLGGLGDEGSAARYFYCAKASKKDRDEGLDYFEVRKTGELQGGRKEGSAGSIMLNTDGTTRVNPYAGTGGPKRNTHPTVKPTELMQYLVRLVTPNGGTVLDPFNGSGSTGKACMYENRERNKGYKYIGIELSEEYLPIARARIEFACSGKLIEEVTENTVKEKPAVPSKVTLW